jgi:hypothetical protein
MKFFNLPKYALTITLGAAMLAACSNNGGSSFAPSGASSGVPGTAHIVVRSQATKLKGRGPFQFISNFGNATTLVFDYPKGDASIGSSGVGASCTNVLFGTGKGTFWALSSNKLEEFKVGGNRPIKTLSAPSGDTLTACAVDPATGDIAATGSSGIIIFRDARGKGKLYSSQLSETFFLGYDNKSNLYVDGFNSGGSFGFVELPKGSKSFETLSGASVEFPGEVQFDGKYITVTDQEADDILGFTCSGTTCTLKRTVSLTGSSDCAGTWIAKGYVICADAGNNDAEIIKYPAGGIIATLTGSFSEPLAAIQLEK